MSKFSVWNIVWNVDLEKAGQVVEVREGHGYTEPVYRVRYVDGQELWGLAGMYEKLADYPQEWAALPLSGRAHRILLARNADTEEKMPARSAEPRPAESAERRLAEKAGLVDKMPSKTYDGVPLDVANILRYSQKGI